MNTLTVPLAAPELVPMPIALRMAKLVFGIMVTAPVVPDAYRVLPLEKVDPASPHPIPPI